MNFNINFAPCTIVNWEWTIAPNAIPKILQIVGKKLEIVFVTLRYYILNIVSKARSVEERTDILDIIKILNFQLSIDPVKRMNKQITDCKKVRLFIVNFQAHGIIFIIIISSSSSKINYLFISHHIPGTVLNILHELFH